MPRTKQPTLKANTRMKVNTPKKDLTPNDLMQMNASLSRAALMSSVLGGSYSGDRNVYTALGYPTSINYADYLGKYSRQDISKRIIEAYPNATWRGKPRIMEDETEIETEFEKKWKAITDKHNVYHYFNRVDKLSGLGRYSVLFLGFAGGDEDLAKDVGTARDLLYLQPYSEANAVVDSLESDKQNERYGLPRTYKLSISDPKATSATAMTAGSVIVHWTRVIHVAENLLESNIYGLPRLKPIYNRLMNLQLLSGGSAEMFWRGAFPGLALEMDAETELSSQDADDLEDEIENYVHKLNRYLRLKGVEAKSLAPQVADPTAHIDSQLKLIAGATGIPVRILTGSERGELSSTQDKENWESRVDERRMDFAEPVILRPFIERLQHAGILSMPSQEIKVIVKWPDTNSLSEKEQAEVSKTRSQALQAYATSGAGQYMLPIDFFTKIMKFSDEEALLMTESMEALVRDENLDFIDPTAGEE